VLEAAWQWVLALVAANSDEKHSGKAPRGPRSPARAIVSGGSGSVFVANKLLVEAAAFSARRYLSRSGPMIWP